MLARKLIALAAILAILLCEIVAALLLLCASGVPERLVAAAGEEYLGGTVTMENLAIGLLDGVRIEGLRIRPDRATGLALDVKSIRLRLHAGELLRGRFSPRSVLVVEPELAIDGGPGGFKALFRGKGGGVSPQLGDFDIAVRKGTVRLGWLALDAHELAVDVTCVDGSCSLERADFVCREQNGGYVGLLSVHGSYDSRGDPPTGQLTVAGEDCVCSPAVDNVLRWVGILESYNAFRPTGRADFCFESNPFVFGTLLTGRITLNPRGGTGSFVGFGDEGDRQGFPYTLSTLEGLLSARVPGYIRMDNICGAGGGGSVTINGEFSQARRGEQFAGSTLVHASDVEIDDELIDALDGAVGGGTVFRQLGLNGPLDASTVVATGPECGVRIAVDVKRAAIKPVYFPFPLGEIRGSVTFEDNLCRLTNLRGERDGIIVFGNGTISGEEIVIRLEAENVTIVPELLDALHTLSPETVELIGKLCFDGGALRIGFEFVERGGDADWDTIKVTVTFCGGSALLPDPAPLAVTDLAGTVTVEITPAGIERIVLDGISGSYEGSSLLVDALLERNSRGEGKAFLDGRLFGDDFGLTLREARLSASGLPLDETVLAVIGGLDDSLKGIADGSEVEGAVDLEATDGPGGASLLVVPRLRRVASPLLPLPLRHVDGEVRWDSASGRVALSELSVRFARGGLFVESGSVEHEEGATLVSFKGSGHALRLNEELGCLLGARGFAEWGLEDVGGQVSFDKADIAIRLGREGEFLSLRGPAEVYLDRAAFGGPVRLENVNGKVTLLSREPDRESTLLEIFACATDLGFRLEGREFSNVKASILATERSFHVVSLDGNLYEGHITGGDDTFGVSFASPSAFSGRVRVDGTDIKRLVGRFDYNLKDISGRLTWDSSFRGTLDEIHRMEAEGRIEVENGRLWRLPVLWTLWSELGLGDDSTMTFDYGSAGYTLANGTVVLSDAILNSPFLKLQGKGELTPDQANVQVQLSVGPRIPVLGFVIDPMMNLIRKGILNFHVTGPYADLTVSYDPILTSPFRSGEIAEQMRCPVPEAYKVEGRF